MPEYTTVRIELDTHKKLGIIANRNRRSMASQIAWWTDLEWSQLFGSKSPEEIEELVEVVEEEQNLQTYKHDAMPYIEPVIFPGSKQAKVLARIVKETRAAQGLSQRDFAVYLCTPMEIDILKFPEQRTWVNIVTPQMIKDWENEVSFPHITTVGFWIIQSREHKDWRRLLGIDLMRLYYPDQHYYQPATQIGLDAFSAFELDYMSANEE